MPLCQPGILPTPSQFLHAILIGDTLVNVAALNQGHSLTESIVLIWVAAQLRRFDQNHFFLRNQASMPSVIVAMTAQTAG